MPPRSMIVNNRRSEKNVIAFQLATQPETQRQFNGPFRSLLIFAELSL